MSLCEWENSTVYLTPHLHLTINVRTSNHCHLEYAYCHELKLPTQVLTRHSTIYACTPPTHALRHDCMNANARVYQTRLPTDINTVHT